MPRKVLQITLPMEHETAKKLMDSFLNDENVIISHMKKSRKVRVESHDTLFDGSTRTERFIVLEV